MSRDVDEKVVKLSLENNGFLSKVKQVISTIGSLDKSMGKAKNINLDRSVQSVNKLQSSVGKVSLKGIENGVSTVQAKFSALSVAAISAFSTIVSRATSAGISMVKSMSVQPILEGFDMYSNKMKTIQVIQANTGAQIPTITATLADLNDYANKTVYSFEDMTTNLGTFTAAGVDLKTAKTDMIGLSNLAAASGSNTQQAAMAMYQLSQAVAAGKVGLADWNSVVNAGMGGQKFQNALKQTGIEMGKDIKQSDNFRESLQSGWLTSDVLNKTLEKFANDKSMLKAATQAKTFSDVMDAADDELKSGWAQTWELIVGDYNQAPALFTSIQNAISDVITKSANARNKLISDFNALGGRQVVIDGLRNAVTALSKIINIVKDAFHDVFPPATADQLLSAAQSFKDFAASMEVSGSTANKLHSVFQGFFSLIDIGLKTIKLLAAAFLGMIPSGTGSAILDIASKLGDMITNFDRSLDSLDDFRIGFISLQDVIDAFGDVASGAMNAVKAGIDAVAKAFAPLGNVVKPMVDGLKDSIKGMFNAVTPQNVANTGIVLALALLVKNISGITDQFKKIIDKFGGVVDHVSDVVDSLDGIKDALKAWTDQVKAKILLEIAAAMVAIAASIKLLEGIPAVDIAKSLEVLGLSLTGMIVALQAISRISDLGGAKAFAASTLIISVSNALLELSVSMKILSSIQPERIGSALLGLAGELGVLIGALVAFSKIPSGPMISSSVAIQILSNALLVLSASLAVVSSIPTDKVISGLLAMAGVMAEISVLGASVSAHPISPATGASLVLIAGSITMISGAVAGLSALPTDNLIKGLSSMAVILAQISLTAAVLDKLNLNSAAVGLVAVAGAIDMMTPAVIALGALPFDRLVQGLTGMTVALTATVTAMKLANGGLAGASAITIAATGIALLVPPLVALSAIPASSMATALIGLGTALTAVGVASRLLNGGVPGLLAFSAAALSVSVTITALSASFAAIAVGIGAIGQGLSAFVQALVNTAGLSSTQITKIGNNFLQLLDQLKAAIPKMTQVAVTFVVSFAQGLATAIPQLANSGLQMVVGLLQGINQNIYQIVALGAQIIIHFSQALMDNAPQLIQTATQLIITLINGVANALRENSQQIIDAVMNLVESIFELVINAGVKVLGILFGWIPGAKGAFNKIGTAAKGALRNAFDVKAEGSKGGKDFADGVGSKAGDAKNSGKSLGTNAKNGSKLDLKSVGAGAGATYITGLNSKKNASKLAGKMNKDAAKNGATGDMTDLGKKLGDTYSKSLDGKKGNAKQAGANNKKSAQSGATGSLSAQGSKAGSTYASGLNGKKGSASTAGRKVGNSAKKGSKVSLKSEGSYAGQGFINGINKWAYNAGKAAAKLANNAKNAVKKALGIRSPSREMAKLGDFTVQGFAKGIDDNAELSTDSSKTMAEKALDATKSAVQGIQESMDSDMDFNPTITPILDTSQLESDATRTNNLLASSIQMTPDRIRQNSVKMDTTALVNQMHGIQTTGSSGEVNVYLTTYGNIDSVTARKWAQPISEALEKVRKNTMRQGGAFA